MRTPARIDGMTNRPTKYLPTWEASIVRREAKLRDTLGAISRSGAFMACILSETGVLEAIVTDSDVRRALLKGAELDDGVMKWANQRPITARDSMSRADLADVCQRHAVRELPLIDDGGRLQDVFVRVVHEHKAEGPLASVPSGARPLPNPILVLAGGLGTRLRGVVNDRPKPLAIVGDRPVLETLISQAVAAGFRRFYVAVNYMSELIEEHLSHPRYAELDIRIVREQKRLGTAGALGLIKDEIIDPVLVCNADVLTTVPMQQVLRFHQEEKAEVTCTVRPYRVTIPYGVVEIDGRRVRQIVEKPTHTHLVNAGIYALSPSVCRLVPVNEPLDMPTLVSMASERGMAIAPFLMHEYWVDIGGPDDFERANLEFAATFGGE